MVIAGVYPIDFLVDHIDLHLVYPWGRQEDGGRTATVEIGYKDLAGAGGIVTPENFAVHRVDRYIGPGKVPDNLWVIAVEVSSPNLVPAPINMALRERGGHIHCLH